MRLTVEEDSQFKTIASDGQGIYYNDAWVRNQQYDALVSCIGRLVLACSLKHHTRRGERNYQNWQKASVLTTAPILKDAGLGSEKGWECSIEEAYGKLPQPKEDKNGKPQGSQPEQGKDPKNQGEILDAPVCKRDGQGASQDKDNKKKQEADVKEEEQNWDEASTQAHQVAKAAGKIPGGVTKTLEESHLHQVTWKTILRRFITENVKSDYSWSKPNRSFVDQGLYLPSLQGKKMKHLVFAIDSSGSMNDKLLQQVWGEIRAAALQVKPKFTTVIQCDTVVRRSIRYKTRLPKHLTVTGRGGTRFSPVFQELKRSRPKLLIYFTDLHCRDYPTHPGYPVIWVVPQKHGKNPPFGKVLVIKQKS